MKQKVLGAPWQGGKDLPINGEDEEMASCGIPDLDGATEPRTGLLRAYPLLCLGLGPGRCSRWSQETRAPVHDRCVCNCLFSSSCKWMLKGFVVH